MATVETIYLGGLRTEATHVQSGTKILTDAPTDNHGKGEAFSPTDLVATALGSCMMTIMGIAATRFKKKNELVAFAGLDPRISESGQNDGDHMHITKKGNKRLRCLLYLAVTCSIRLKRDDNSIKDFYIKKKQQSNPMCSKAAKTACASKLVRIIYSMCKTGELYQYNK